MQVNISLPRTIEVPEQTSDNYRNTRDLSKAKETQRLLDRADLQVNALRKPILGKINRFWEKQQELQPERRDQDNQTGDFEKVKRKKIKGIKFSQALAFSNQESLKDLKVKSSKFLHGSSLASLGSNPRQKQMLLVQREKKTISHRKSIDLKNYQENFQSGQQTLKNLPQEIKKNLLEKEDQRGRNPEQKEGSWKEFSSIKAKNLQIDPQLSARILSSNDGENKSTDRDQKVGRMLKVRGQNMKNLAKPLRSKKKQSLKDQLEKEEEEIRKLISQGLQTSLKSGVFGESPLGLYNPINQNDFDVTVTKTPVNEMTDSFLQRQEKKSQKFSNLLKNDKLKSIEMGFYVKNYQNQEIGENSAKKETTIADFQVKSPLAKLYEKVEMKKKFLQQKRNLSLSNSKDIVLKLPELASSTKIDHKKNQSIVCAPQAQRIDLKQTALSPKLKNSELYSPLYQQKLSQKRIEESVLVKADPNAPIFKQKARRHYERHYPISQDEIMKAAFPDSSKKKIIVKS